MSVLATFLISKTLSDEKLKVSCFQNDESKCDIMNLVVSIPNVRVLEVEFPNNLNIKIVDIQCSNNGNDISYLPIDLFKSLSKKR